MNTSICSRLKNVSIFFLALTCCVTQPSLADMVVPGEEGPASFEALGIVIPEPAPDRNETEGEGPFDRLVIENVMLVNGLGAPPRGHVSRPITTPFAISFR